MTPRSILTIGCARAQADKPQAGKRVQKFMDSPGCHCVIQVQKTTVDALMRGSHKRTAFTQHYHGKAGKECLSGTHPNGQHKVVEKNPLPKMRDVPEGFTRLSEVYACTLYREHCSECLQPTPNHSASAAAGHTIDDPDASSIVETNFVSFCGSPSSVAPSSASQLQPKQGATGAQSSLSAKQLATFMRAKYDLNTAIGAKQWTWRDILREAHFYDPNTSKHMAGHVLRCLKRRCAIGDEKQIALFQALAVCLSRVGHRVVLHTASGKQVRSIILDTARKRYLAHARSLKTVRLSKWTPELLANLLKSYPEDDLDRSEEFGKGGKYLMGFTIVWANMVTNGCDLTRGNVPSDGLGNFVHVCLHSVLTARAAHPRCRHPWWCTLDQLEARSSLVAPRCKTLPAPMPSPAL